MHWYQIGFLITFIPLMVISLVFPFIREWRFRFSEAFDNSLENDWIEWLDRKLEKGFNGLNEAVSATLGYLVFSVVINGFIIILFSAAWPLVLPVIVVSFIFYQSVGKRNKEQTKSDKKEKIQTKIRRMNEILNQTTKTKGGYRNIKFEAPPKQKKEKKKKVSEEWEIQEYDNPAHIVGCRITLYDEPNNRTEHCNVININEKRGELQVKYDDGLKEWIPIDIIEEMAKIKFTE